MKTAKDLVKENYTWLDHSDTLSRAMGALKNEVSGEALVFKDEVLTGIFSPSFTIRSKIDFMKAKVGNFTRPAPLIDSGESPDEIARMMLASGFSLLPVTEKGRVVGSIHSLDLLDYLAQNTTSMSLRKIHDEVGPRRAITMQESEKLGKAVQFFHNTSAHSLLLTDEKNRPGDMLTRYDLMRHSDLYSHKRENSGRSKMQTKAFKANLPDMDALQLSNFVNYRPQLLLQEDKTVKDAIREMNAAGRLSFLLKKKDELFPMHAKDLLKYYAQVPSTIARESQRSAASESV